MRLLLDPAWLKAKLEATGAPSALVADYEQFGVGEAQSLIGRTLRLTSGICARDPRQLLPQLMGRLQGFEGLGGVGLFGKGAERPLGPGDDHVAPEPHASRRRDRKARRPLGFCRRSLPAARRAARLGLWDNTIRLWDLTTGAETARLEGHASSVTSLCLLPDGRLASGSGTTRSGSGT